MYPRIVFTICLAVLEILQLQKGVLGAQHAVDAFDSAVISSTVSTTPFDDSSTAEIRIIREIIPVAVTTAVFKDTQGFHTVPEILMLNGIEGTKDMSVKETLFLACETNASLKWVYQHPRMTEPTTLDSLNITEISEGRTVTSKIKLRPKSYNETGRYSCISVNTGTTIGSVYIFVYQKNNLLLPISPFFYFTASKSFAVPCLVTNSQAQVTLWKKDCYREVFPLNDSYYDPTKGFVVPDPVKGFMVPNPAISFNEFFCCSATLNGEKTARDLFLIFIPATSWKPRVTINATGDLHILVNSSLTLECSITVSFHARITNKWTHPPTKRIETTKPVLNWWHHGYNEFISELILTGAQKEDSGLYKCNSTDHSDRWGYMEVKLYVLDPEKPYFTETNMSSSEREAVPGEEVEISCQVKGFPKPMLKWYHNEVLINDTNTTDVKFDVDQEKLIISRFHANDSGVYECWAENEYGAASKIITLLEKNEKNESLLPTLNPTDAPEEQTHVIPLIVLGVGLFIALILVLVVGRKFCQHKYFIHLNKPYEQSKKNYPWYRYLHVSQNGHKDSHVDSVSTDKDHSSILPAERCDENDIQH